MPGRISGRVVEGSSRKVKGGSGETELGTGSGNENGSWAGAGSWTGKEFGDGEGHWHWKQLHGGAWGEQVHSLITFLCTYNNNSNILRNQHIGFLSTHYSALVSRPDLGTRP